MSSAQLLCIWSVLTDAGHEPTAHMHCIPEVHNVCACLSSQTKVACQAAHASLTLSSQSSGLVTHYVNKGLVQLSDHARLSFLRLTCIRCGNQELTLP